MFALNSRDSRLRNVDVLPTEKMLDEGDVRQWFDPSFRAGEHPGAGAGDPDEHGHATEACAAAPSSERAGEEQQEGDTINCVQAAQRGATAENTSINVMAARRQAVHKEYRRGFQAVQRMLDRRVESDATEQRHPVGTNVLVHVPQSFRRKTDPVNIRGRVHAMRQSSVGEMRYAIVSLQVS